MATRLKTIYYCLSGSILDTTTEYSGSKTFLPIDIYIPETGSRTFQSCWLDLWMESFRDTAPIFSDGGIRANFFNSASVLHRHSCSYGNSGEQCTFNYVANLTPLFISQFPSDRNVAGFTASLHITSSPMTNITAMVGITYEWDDTCNRRMKSVAIPLDTTASVSTTASFFVDTIPSLLTYCPEANKTFRDIYLHVEGSDYRTSTTTLANIDFAIGSFTSSIQNTGSLASQQFHNYYFPYKNIDPSSSYSLLVRTNTTAARALPNAFTLYATYEYDEDASSQILNSVVFGSNTKYGFLPPSFIGDDTFVKKFFIEEPSPITQSNCATYHYFYDGSDVNLTLYISGSGVRRSRQAYSGATMCGGWAASWRWNSGSRQNQAFSMSRGENTIISVVTSNTDSNNNRGNFYSSYHLINYISNKSSQPGGSANHNQTRFVLLTGSNGLTTDVYYRYTSSVLIPEPNYYVHDNLVYGNVFSAGGGSGITYNIEASGSSELFSGSGWVNAWGNLLTSDSEQGWKRAIIPIGNYFKSYPQNPDNSLLDTSTRQRIHLIQHAGYFRWHGWQGISYSTITYDISGSISDYTGDGSGIVVNAYTDNDKKKVLTMTTDAGGSFSSKWYNSAVPLYCEAYQDDTHLGRSAASTASGQP